MKKFLKNILLLLLTTIIISIPIVTFADVGSYESYDSGGSDSYSSSSSSWDYDDYSSGSSSSYDGDSSLGGFIILIVIGIIIFATFKSKGKKGQTNYSAMAQVPFANEEEIENKVKAIDELFNKEEFIAWSKDVFVKLQEAWTARDWSTIRYFETNELFEQHQKQLQGYINNHQINMMERICVKSASLSEFKQVGDKDVLTVTLSSKMIDYIINDETKNIIKGDKTTDRHSTYKLVFVRKTGVKTKPGMNTVNTTNCPNCGAPTQITSSGKCEYCGSVITTGEYSWVLSNLEKIG